jgi:Restriction Endonuclease associating with ARP
LTDASLVPKTSLADWTADEIDVECEVAYSSYVGQIRRQHIAYFADRPQQRSEAQPFVARTRQAAFPDGCEHLAHALAETAWHRHHLSAASSQVLAVALLGSAACADPTLQWLPTGWRFRRALTLFEVELAATMLNERPRQTSVDWLAIDCEHVTAAEAKFTERGFGRCSCELRDSGLCSERVLERPYWDVASRDMALDRQAGRCSLSLAYQAVRNVAAAQAIAAGRRRSAFVLLYDIRNPYFAGTRAWPGWITMLTQLVADSTTLFIPLSWQNLLATMDVDSPVRQWAAEKHGLGAE